ncbi:MAG: sulfatase [Sedimentisphaerales bacterium]|nr:sulfatase [Sedimentisphaerales bacterium]
MNRRQFLKITAVSVGVSCLPGLSSLAKSGRKHNIVFFLVDDLGWTDLGCYGSSFYETPNMDRLAAEGMRFTDAYAACPVCSPTRASIMTGKYPTRVGITDWIQGMRKQNPKLITPEDRHELSLEEITFPEVLKRNGYTTFFAGKWHLGSEGYYPEDQGFDINIGGHDKGSPPGGYFSPYNNPKLSDGPKGEYLTDRLAEESVRFLETRKDQSNPFLLYLSFYTVHTPIQAKQEHIDKYKAKLESLPGLKENLFRPERVSLTKLKQNEPSYAGMVESMDTAVGKVLDKIRQLGMDQNTIIFFMSDNGGLSTLPKRRRWAPTSNVPLRTGKGWCYEGGIREPMIVKWPDVTQPGSVCSVPVISTDFYPTILEMVGLPLLPEQHRDGMSLVPLLKSGCVLDRQAIYWHYPHYHGSGHRPSGAIRAGDWKLIEFFEDNTVELYNLRRDLSEQHNLAAALPDKVDGLKRMLNDWRKATGARMPRPNPDYDPSKDPDVEQ